MPLTPGSRLGPYEVIAALGAGGMGEVFRARDARLDRDVAIKVLPDSVATDPAALARFEREAMAVARLSHPNILSIFEFVKDGPTAFVVMELVDGETLRDRLAAGPVPARRALVLALQIARGIGAAHARGIVHRDLKPENVMITREDHVKILDFGLAKPVGPSESDVTRGGTAVTAAGTVLGTIGYMAPEQVRGLAVDHRADMFAFGAVLYEMLCGKRPFRDDTAADTMSAILTKDPPDLDLARWTIPPGLDRIVRRCLEKAPELRFQSASDLAFALETLTTAATGSAQARADVPARRQRGSAWLPWTMAALAAAAAVAAWMTRPPAPPVGPRWDTFTRISELAGEETSPGLSPDGATVAYAVRAGASWDIYAQRVGGRNATPIIADPARDEGGPAFSPDGRSIAFHEADGDGGIFIAGATGESIRRVTDLGFHPAWAPDSRRIAFTTERIIHPSSRQGESTLYVVDAAGGTPRKVVDGDAAQASWSPSGDRLVYWANTGGQRDIFTVAAGGGERTAVTDDVAIDWSPVWSPDGRFIYFGSDRGGAMNLWRAAVDPAGGRAHGDPEAVTNGVQAATALPSFSKDGSRLAFQSRVWSINPVAIPFDPATGRAGTPFVLDARNNIRIPSDMSPDGTLLAFSSIGEDQEDLFVGAPTGAMRRVTDDAARDRAPLFTPDGRSLVFYSNRSGRWEAWMIGVDGGGLRQITNVISGAVYPGISPRGDIIVFTAMSGSVFLAPLEAAAVTSPPELPGTTSGGSRWTPTAWSPDGARLAGTLSTPGGLPSGVGVYNLVTRSLAVVATDPTYFVRWLAGGRRLMYFTKNGTDLVVLDTVTGARRVVDVRLPAPSTGEHFALSPEGRAIYYGAERAEADIWIVGRR